MLKAQSIPENIWKIPAGSLEVLPYTEVLCVLEYSLTPPLFPVLIFFFNFSTFMWNASIINSFAGILSPSLLYFIRFYVHQFQMFECRDAATTHMK